MTQLVQQSLTEKLDQIEAKERENALEHLTKKPKGKAGITPLEQKTAIEIPVPVSESFDRLEKIFDEHAQKIMNVSSKPELVSTRLHEAFVAIRKYAPLSYRDDKKIEQRLESLIIEKANLNASTSPEEDNQTLRVPPIETFTPPDPTATLATLARLMRGEPPALDDPLIGRAINASRIKTRGTIKNADE